jgi:hypothetical protein
MVRLICVELTIISYVYRVIEKIARRIFSQSSYIKIERTRKLYRCVQVKQRRKIYWINFSRKPILKLGQMPETHTDHWSKSLRCASKFNLYQSF